MEPYGICPRSIYIPANLLASNSQPQGADIYLNGTLVGTTPKEILVKNMPLKVEIRKDGHRQKSKVLASIPADNKISMALPKIPTGYLKISGVGVNTFINGVRVPNGQKFSVPANSVIKLEFVDPLSGQTWKKRAKVRPNKIDSLVFDKTTGTLSR